MLSFNLTFGQNSRSVGGILTGIPMPNAPNEIFRFQPGNVTQEDFGTGFGFTSENRWFSLGRVETGANTAYGLRFQAGAKAVTFGYQDVNSLNPRIQWIGTGASLGNLEFRVANSFMSTSSTLVATMTSEGNTVFGNPSLIGSNAKVSIENNMQIGLRIQSTNNNQGFGIGFSVDQSSASNENWSGAINTTSAIRNYGLYMKTGIGEQSIGIQSFAFDSQTSIGLRGTTFGQDPFEASIYGETPNNNGSQWAGYFDGDVQVIGGFSNPSDKKLKENVEIENNILEKLSQLTPVNYDFKNVKELNLPSGLQHGFIAQELEAVFPELIKESQKPVFDKEGKVLSQFNYKSVNYIGLISLLTGGINELNEEVKALKQELADLTAAKSSNGSLINSTKAVLEQNVPNPFSDRTVIRYELPTGSGAASLMVFDLTGKIIKEIALTREKDEVTITASQIGKGLFIYSLVQSGQELISKKMVIK